ncbi:DUF2076 domain-containing protein [Reyranella massiliensis]|uniref:DUF2076 domain-containing protein n=1 Tax=Reyranella massiliensis TaxID=445220 RepID=UPI00031247DE|nr:DUF2076 domain-containing protein [Reyranella massiliensis]
MQNQERELITGLFGRLQPFESQPRDAEADAMIRDLAARQPASAYLLVQTVLVQEQALKAAQERIAELEAKAAAAPAGGGGGFLGSAPKIGPWGSAPAAQSPAAQAPAAQAPAPRPSVPSTRSPLQAAVGPQAAGGGGFLRTAMATAAGVAGGALLFEGIRNLMGGSSNPFSQGASSQQAATPQTPSELMPPDSAQSAQQEQQAYDQDAGLQDDYDTASYDDGGGDDSWG